MCIQLVSGPLPIVCGSQSTNHLPGDYTRLDFIRVTLFYGLNPEFIAELLSVFRRVDLFHLIE